MNVLAKLVREIVDAHLEEEKKYTGPPSFGYKIIDKEKAEKVKKLYAGHYIADLIDAVEEAGEAGATRGGLSKILDIKDMKLNDDLKALFDNGIISRGRPEKAPKPEKTGQRGRKASDKSRVGITRTLFQNFKDNPDFEPTEDDITYNIPKGLGTEKLEASDINKIKKKALGVSKRGRPKTKTDDLDDLRAAMSEEMLNEQFTRMKKLAGLL
jgi:hypothetical protein